MPCHCIESCGTLNRNTLFSEQACGPKPFGPSLAREDGELTLLIPTQVTKEESTGVPVAGTSEAT